MNTRSLMLAGSIFLLITLAAGPALAFFCPNCGHDFAARAKFCSNCGLPLNKVQEFVENYRSLTQQHNASMNLEIPAAQSTPATPVEAPEPKGPAKHDVSITKSSAGTVVIEAEGAGNRKDSPSPEPEPETAAGYGSMEVILLYQGSDPEKYSKSGRVYVNDKLIGSIYMISKAEMVGKGGYSTELFGYASGLSNKRYYRFQADKIPLGTYQVKVVLHKKGFLRRSAYQKVWKTVGIKVNQNEKLFYEWGDSRNFGE